MVPSLNTAFRNASRQCVDRQWQVQVRVHLMRQRVPHTCLLCHAAFSAAHSVPLACHGGITRLAAANESPPDQPAPADELSGSPAQPAKAQEGNGSWLEAAGLSWNPLHLSGQNDSLLTDTFSMQRPDRQAHPQMMPLAGTVKGGLDRACLGSCGGGQMHPVAPLVHSRPGRCSSCDARLYRAGWNGSRLTTTLLRALAGWSKP